MDRETDRYRLFPELVAFEAAARDEPSVLGVLYAGSLGRGTFDRFSDLDIMVWLKDEASVSTMPGCTRRSSESVPGTNPASPSLLVNG
jgi:hypothetical protein